MRGRKIVLTPTHIDRIVQAIRVGSTWTMASAYAGISKDTLDRWRRQMVQAKDGTLLAELRARLTDAEGQAGVRWLVLIGQAAQQDWKAAAWLLAHRYPEQYGSGVRKVAPTTPDGQAPWQPQVTLLPSQAPSMEEWTQLVQQLAPHGQRASGREGTR